MKQATAPVFKPGATITIAYCPYDHKRIATFSARGLLVICKECHVEWAISYQEITWIEAGFKLRAKDQAI
jgi:hypothetical protein